MEPSKFHIHTKWGTGLQAVCVCVLHISKYIQCVLVVMVLVLFMIDSIWIIDEIWVAVVVENWQILRSRLPRHHHCYTFMILKQQHQQPTLLLLLIMPKHSVLSSLRCLNIRSYSSQCHKTISVGNLLQSQSSGSDVTVHGFIRSIRKQKTRSFLAIGDGTSLEPLQALLTPTQAERFDLSSDVVRRSIANLVL